MSTRIRLLCLVVLPLLVAASSCRDDEPAPVTVEPPVSEPRDTTSHDFIWEFDTVGLQFSMIHGVAAVSENDIWVSGQFDGYREDWGKNGVVGNVAHWDGRDWEMFGFNAVGGKSWYPLDDAKAFGPNNVWICGGSPFRWDGSQWKRYPYKGFYFGSGINDIWSSADQQHVCVVGYNRSVALYSPEKDTFEWVNMPHEEHFWDVSGNEDGTIFVAGGNPDNGDSHIYRIYPEGTVEEWLYLQHMLVFNIWFRQDTLFVSSGSSVYQLVVEKTNLMRPVTRATRNIVDVEMNAENNIIAVTEGDTFLHYNGSTWKEMPFPYPKSVTATDLAVVGKHVIIVGYTPEQYCLVMKGTRL